MKKQLVTILSIALLLSSATLVAQTNNTIDTTNPIKIDLKNVSWNVKITNGIHRSYFFEAGISRCTFTGSRHGTFGSVLSMSYRLYPDFRADNTIHGIVSEAAFLANMFGTGIELGYLFNHKANDFMITPKVFFGVSNVNIHYGYAFSTNKYSFSRIGKHQFGLTINLPFYWNDKLRKKKSWGLNIYGKKR